jgi:hypothetical protein
MFIDFDPTSRSPNGSPGFLLRRWVGSCFPFADRVFKALALTLAEGSLVDSSPGDWPETGMAGIRMSPSKPGMGEMKLSKACIQTRET